MSVSWRAWREKAQRGFVSDDLVDCVGDQRWIVLEAPPLRRVHREQVQCIGDGADRGVERRTDVVDHQGCEFSVGHSAVVGGEKDLMAHAALDEAAFANDPAGVSQHAQACGQAI